MEKKNKIPWIEGKKVLSEEKKKSWNLVVNLIDLIE